MSILIKISFFLVILKLILSHNYIKIPEVEINKLQPVLYPDTALQNEEQQQAIINQTFEIVFSEIPQVLISINHLDLWANSLQNINFQVNLLQINLLSFNATVQKSQNQELYGLNIQYLAINIKDAYVKKGTFQFSNQIYNQDSQWVYAKQSFNYQRSDLDFDIWNVSISVYIIGIDKSVQQTKNAYLSIISEINYQSYYSIQTYIEQSINPPYSTNPILSDKGNQEIITPQYNILIDKIAGIFYGFTGFEMTLDQVFRLSLKEKQIILKQQQHKVRYQYLHNQIATKMEHTFQMIREPVLKIAQILDTIKDKFLILQKETQTIAYNVINLAKYVMVKLLRIVYLVKNLITFSKSNVWLVLNNAQTILTSQHVL
ncbi:H-type lectin domain protein (macronuclear) [Tetrahymena thermophila SB210]|uniref:H-type lectin domain protein n=1 Tax=Tetrahymena thermophila (strain SB210) TaxID=312017 RepID=Q22TP9_TETTS|nr:H-type lectin domain protein [Tetrahymena thermophila SB210]EAR88658.3 H-type lectin domain protein [Tetrahymena thermophila SB210]|eukprot:XP_001008903.3 H-type lectin domain protein [Tetrahymena thermophila SB210]